MQASFNELVGTSGFLAPACHELEGLTPALDTGMAIDGLAPQASEASGTFTQHVNPTTHC